MSYYNHESLPWPRRPVQDQNSFYVDYCGNDQISNSTSSRIWQGQSFHNMLSSNLTRSANNTDEAMQPRLAEDCCESDNSLDDPNDLPYTGGPVYKQQRKYKNIIDSLPHTFVMTSLYAIANFVEDDSRTTLLFIKMDPVRASFLHTINYLPFKRSLFSLLGVECERLMRRLRRGCGLTRVRVAEGAVRKKDKCRDVSIKKKQPKAQKNNSAETNCRNSNQTEPVPVTRNQDEEKNQNDKNPPEVPQKKMKTKPTKSMIRLETLDEILAFVKDNKKTEMKLKYDRKFLRGVVKSVTNKNPKWILNSGCCDEERTKWMTVYHEICYHNDYELVTTYQKYHPGRQLIVIKVPLPHVYLITREHLITTDDEVDENIYKKSNEAIGSNQLLTALTIKKELPDYSDIDYKNVKMKTEQIEVKKENTNHITRAEIKTENVVIKQATSNESNAKATAYRRQMHLQELFKKYLKQFFESPEFTEMRFLGVFDETEQNVLNDFVLKLHQYLLRIESKNDWLSDTVRGNRYAIQFDNNGNEMIVKTL